VRKVLGQQRRRDGLAAFRRRLSYVADGYVRSSVPNQNVADFGFEDLGMAMDELRPSPSGLAQLVRHRPVDDFVDYGDVLWRKVDDSEAVTLSQVRGVDDSGFAARQAVEDALVYFGEYARLIASVLDCAGRHGPGGWRDWRPDRRLAAKPAA